MVDNIDSLLSLAAGVPNISIERFDEKHSHFINIFTVSKYSHLSKYWLDTVGIEQFLWIVLLG